MKKGNPLVSIIIPCFNEENWIEYCLKSLSNQSYKNTEIILVDDKSTDNSVKKASEFKKVKI